MFNTWFKTLVKSLKLIYNHLGATTCLLGGGASFSLEILLQSRPHFLRGKASIARHSLTWVLHSSAQAVYYFLSSDRKIELYKERKWNEVKARCCQSQTEPWKQRQSLGCKLNMVALCCPQLCRSFVLGLKISKQSFLLHIHCWSLYTCKFTNCLKSFGIDMHP